MKMMSEEKNNLIAESQRLQVNDVDIIRIKDLR